MCAILELLSSILRIYGLAEISYDYSFYELESFIQSSSGVCLFCLGITDGYTIYKEVSSIVHNIYIIYKYDIFTKHWIIKFEAISKYKYFSKTNVMIFNIYHEFYLNWVGAVVILFEIWKLGCEKSQQKNALIKLYKKGIHTYLEVKSNFIFVQQLDSE